jgi:hypothetical protein
MAWETRSRGARYYTRSRRENGQVVREYVGCGPAAELIAAMDGARRAARQADAERAREQREAMLSLESRLTVARCTVEAAEAEFLEALGYHCHRGEWRRRRGGQ